MRRLLVIVLVVLTLAGCGGDPRADSVGDLGASGDGSRGDPGEVAPDDRPAPEDVGRVDSGESGGGGGSVDLPGLPIGGDSVEFDAADTRCAVVTWTGESLPETVRVRITGFSVPDQFAVVTPGGYDLSGDRCLDAPPCLSEGWLDLSGSACTVAISWTGRQPADEEPWSLAASSGTATCEVADECDRAYTLAGDGGFQAIRITATALPPDLPPDDEPE